MTRINLDFKNRGSLIAIVYSREVWKEDLWALTPTRVHRWLTQQLGFYRNFPNLPNEPRSASDTQSLPVCHSFSAVAPADLKSLCPVPALRSLASPGKRGWGVSMTTGPCHVWHVMVWFAIRPPPTFWRKLVSSVRNILEVCRCYWALTAPDCCQFGFSSLLFSCLLHHDVLFSSLTFACIDRILIIQFEQLSNANTQINAAFLIRLICTTVKMKQATRASESLKLRCIRQINLILQKPLNQKH